ncbi:putative chromatin remodeling & transcription regulator ABTB family [Helianthus annuus]|uniref:Chromatin remodeling & transcription regulator ABTB family n=1 Tax=Helianthus annuus TaxID=4232 RepID=A0A251T425_HELAN|nr:BTB/POZ domain and ankyrin repeat-containing protein NPR1 [Helianthus annuus]KAF5779273.1 putative chromatin remodeling & transcription regulator ABTB family [Helianthus annuus]KAJ0490563.1 putative chromatin remodeling & transcription regulator ABTB family [Helianthus annuus]KAJ0494814.1 putative chromatin remodeling & transcription regulator ABTB family [Helianthus annuus]KAJ0506482.1 putative chromatin remodeling & transcription regulator ABTB family [Helianthus annuus]KAJ0676160.1 putat
MANYSEPSSSISFTSPSHISNGSNGHNSFQCSSIADTRSNLEIISLNKLSSSLGKLLTETDSSYSDAIVVVEGNDVCVHRCILAARSTFFCNLFKESKDCVEENGKVKYIMTDILPFGHVGYDAFTVFLSFLYAGKLKSSPPEVSTCVHGGCPHDACRPAIAFAVELMYAAVVFQVPELVPLFQRRLLNFIEKALVEDVIPILLVAFHCELTQILTQCVHRIARSDLDDVSLEKELPPEVSKDVKLLRSKSLDGKDPVGKSEEAALREKRIRQIHKALDSDDVELVKLLLSESNITLDEANALHYTVAYCDPKVVKEVLSLNMADVNRRNARGYTVLHVAAMRKEPSILVSLLSKQVSVLEVTQDGRSAVGICKQLTRPKDYNAKTEHGEEANKDRLCIDVLEREIIRNSMGGDVPMSSTAMADDLHMKLLHLENRVAFARLLFPTEAKLAIESAHAQIMSATNGLNGNLKMDLNETPSVQHKRLVLRIESLSKTVEMGRRFFPNCSEVLDKFMLDDLPDVFYLEKGTPEEQVIKRTRFVELKEDVQRAFSKDKAEQPNDLTQGIKNRSRKYS